MTVRLTFVPLALVLVVSAVTFAQPVAPVDLGSLSLGAKIVGPVGPEVDATITFDDNGTITGIADLIGSVSCDDRFVTGCAESDVQGFSDVVYTYVHQVIPGVDLPNDPPFPAPDVVIPFDDVTEFRLGFTAHGFNGVAGFDFGEATAAVGSPAVVTIDQTAGGELVWSLPDGSGWDTGETLTFFWQTDRRPVGPGGVYIASDGGITGSGAGPLPDPVPEPSGWVLALIAWIGFRVACSKRVAS